MASIHSFGSNNALEVIDITRPQIGKENLNCSFCDKIAITIRKHSGQSLCSDCFLTSIEKIIANTISKYNMLKPRDQIIIALSGGKDSITLLYNLIKIQKKIYIPRSLIALTIDEGIEGYRENTIGIAKNFCKKYGIEHKIVSFKERFGMTLDDIVKKKKKSTNHKYACNYCATIRRRLLNDVAKELGADILALGHNLTDICETFLMNILYKRINLIGSQFPYKEESEEIRNYYIKKVSPLMRLPEEEISLYTRLNQFETYNSHCPYRKKDPILRRRVLDFIQSCKVYSPEIEFNLFNGFSELSNIIYHYYGKQKHKLCKICGYPSGSAKICSYCSLKEELSL
ncbi:MAG: ATP-binding protein [Promethearchaeota archaeon]